jgi:hypothetical protein
MLSDGLFVISFRAKNLLKPGLEEVVEFDLRI